MSKKIYCSIGAVPKGQKLGSMQQCAEKKQIRYYGIKKIDQKLLEAIKKGSKAKESRDKLAIKMVGLRGKISKLNKQIPTEKDKKEKEKLKKEVEKIKADLEETSNKFSKLDKIRQGSRISRGSSLMNRSRKNSNRGSSRRNSKRGSTRRNSNRGAIRRNSNRGSSRRNFRRGSSRRTYK